VSKYVADHRAHLWFEREFLRREEFLERREMGFKAKVQRGGHAAMCGRKSPCASAGCEKTP
jgi:hypothetical protein